MCVCVNDKRENACLYVCTCILVHVCVCVCVGGGACVQKKTQVNEPEKDPTGTGNVPSLCDNSLRVSWGK